MFFSSLGLIGIIFLRNQKYSDETYIKELMANQIDVPGLSIKKRNNTILNLIKKNKNDQHRNLNNIEKTNAGQGVSDIKHDESIKDVTLKSNESLNKNFKSNNLNTIK